MKVSSFVVEYYVISIRFTRLATYAKIDPY